MKALRNQPTLNTSLPSRVLLLNAPVIKQGRYVNYMTDWTGAEFSAAILLPSLEFLNLHAILKQHTAVEYLDASAGRLTPGQVIEFQKKHGFELVIMAMNADNRSEVSDLAARLKAESRKIRIAVFGAFATIEAEKVLEVKSIDYVLLGEPEPPVIEFCRGEVRHNLAYRHQGRVARLPRKLLDDLDAISHASRELLEPALYQAVFARRQPFTVINTSRGCSFGKCTFCVQDIYTIKGVRYHSIDYVMQEIEHSLALGFREIFFRDEVFTENRQRVLELCRRIEEKKLRFAWRIMTRLACVDAELLETMKKAGCYQVSYGFESSSPAALQANSKGQNLAQADRIARLTKEVGLEVVGNFVIGLYGDEEEKLKEIARYAHSLGCDYAQFTIAATWNGYQSAESAGQLSREKLVKLARRAYYRFYFHPRFLLKMILRLLKRPANLMILLKTSYRYLTYPVVR